MCTWTTHVLLTSACGNQAGKHCAGIIGRALSSERSDRKNSADGSISGGVAAASPPIKPRASPGLARIGEAKRAAVVCRRSSGSSRGTRSRPARVWVILVRCTGSQMRSPQWRETHLERWSDLAGCRERIWRTRSSVSLDAADIGSRTLGTGIIGLAALGALHLAPLVPRGLRERGE